MHPGQIVEFIEEGRVFAAVCLEERRGRIRTLTEAQREVSLSPSRLTHVSEARIPLNQAREDLVRKLKERAALREELAAKIDVNGLWEVLHEEGGEYSPMDMAELAFGGQINDDQTSAVIRAMLSDRVFFRFRVQGFRPNDSETVEKILIQRAKEQEKGRQIHEGGQWIRALWTGEDVQPPEGHIEIVELLKEYAIYGKGAPRARHTEEILRSAGMSQRLAAFKILVRLGVWSPDENLFFHRFGTRRVFPVQVLEEARLLRQRSVSLRQGDPAREDLLELSAVTIDSPHTRDIDDALSLDPLQGRYLLGIHITDVSQVVQLGSPLDEEASLRATSLYLPEGRIPMFPPEVSEDLVSLKSGKIRGTVSLLLEVDEQGRVLDHRYSLAWIKVKRRLSYEEADESLQTPEHPLSPLVRIAQVWREERIRRGALLLPLPEVTVRAEEEAEIILERRDRESPSQVLVSEMMIQANRFVAQRLKDLGLPCIYRSQEEPRERILGATLGDLLTNYRQRKLLSRAELQLEPAFHHGLGVEDYTTITSPIRRYPDLVMQRQLTASLKGEPPVYDRSDLERILMETEETLNQAGQLEMARQRYWLLRYLEGRKGEETHALVLGRQGNRIQLLLTEYMLEAAVPTAPFSWMQEGQELMVRIVRSRPVEDELRVEPC